jgi:hypothetical protein
VQIVDLWRAAKVFQFVWVRWRRRRRRASTSWQISAIFSNASSRPRFFCTRRFTFGSFGARGCAPLAIGAFDAADEAGTAERDLRFPIISATLRVALKNYQTAFEYNSGSGDSASDVPQRSAAKCGRLR